jgi:hypothetical protein
MAKMRADQCLVKNGVCQNHPDDPHCLNCSVPWFHHGHIENSTAASTTTLAVPTTNGEEHLPPCVCFRGIIKYYGYVHSISEGMTVNYPKPRGHPSVEVNEGFLRRFDGTDSEWPIKLLSCGMDQSAYNLFHWFAQRRRKNKQPIIKQRDPFEPVNDFIDGVYSRWEVKDQQDEYPFEARALLCIIVSMMLLKVKMLLDLVDLQTFNSILDASSQSLPSEIIDLIGKHVFRSPLIFLNSEIMSARENSALIVKVQKQVKELFDWGVDHNDAIWTEILFDEIDITDNALDEAHDICGHSVALWHEIPGALATLRALIDKYLLLSEPQYLYERMSDSKGDDWYTALRELDEKCGVPQRSRVEMLAGATELSDEDGEMED